MFSGDPNVITNANLIKNISYEEMLEAATNGAKVLHNRSVSVAKKYKLPIFVKHFRNSKGGTIVEERNGLEEYGPKIISFEKKLTKISLIGDGMFSNMDYMSKIYEVASKMNVKIYMISCNELCINILVKEEQAEEFGNAIHNELIKK
ncbi:MAG: aspartate kinase [Clostridia bacterium]|nr:aspartate kinase [Clostridia bacterium]